MIDLVQNNIYKIRNVCEEHNVKELYLFGSAARGNDFTKASDIDFLVSFQPIFEGDNNEAVFIRIKNLEDLHQKLEIIINRKVDLIQEKSIKNKYLKYFINKDKLMIYGLP